MEHRVDRSHAEGRVDGLLNSLLDLPPRKVFGHLRLVPMYSWRRGYACGGHFPFVAWWLGEVG